MVRLQAEPSSISVRVGESVSLSVAAIDASGAEVDVPLRVVGPRNGVRVDDGELRGISPGSYDVIATYSGGDGEPVTLTIPVTVTWPAVARLAISSEPGGRLYEGTRIRHTATAYHRDGSARPGATIAWQSSNPQVATVDRFGNVSARSSGDVTITASFEGVDATVSHRVTSLPVAGISLSGGSDEVRTGDVQTFTAVAVDDRGMPVQDAPILWTHSFIPADGMLGTSAPGQLSSGKFVADVPGVYTVIASVGPVSTTKSFEVVPRDVVRPLEVIGAGRQSTIRTTDFWVFEGQDGRDYVITGSKVADGHAYVFDVTDPTNIIKTDSIQVDARSVNDVKVSPDARYATVTREGASNRRNGVVILDLANPAPPDHRLHV